MKLLLLVFNKLLNFFFSILYSNTVIIRQFSRKSVMIPKSKCLRTADKAFDTLQIIPHLLCDFE